MKIKGAGSVVDTCYILKAMVEMIKKVSAGFRGHNMEIVNKVKRENLKLEQEIIIIAVDQQAVNLEAARQSMDKLVEAVEYKIVNGILFSEKAVQELTLLFEALSVYLVNIKDWLITENNVLQRHVKIESAECTARCRDFATMHEERLIKGICMVHSSGVYLKMLDGMRGLFYNTGRLVA
jgi:Na+/phosphate symporter